MRTTTTMNRTSTLALFTLCFVAAGCSVLAPLRDRSRFFTLTPLPARDAASGADAITYGLGPIKLAPYLDRDAIATRVSPTEVTYSATDRWAEPLQANITRVLLQNLFVLLDTDRIAVYPWPGAFTADYQVRISVLRFESDTKGEAHLDAQWEIQDGRNGGYVTTRTSTFTHPATAATTAAAVNAMSLTLEDLGRDIAAALAQARGSRETH